MGVLELMLLAMLLFSFCSPASISPVSKSLLPVNTHENMMGDNELDETNSIIGGSRTMVNESNYTTVERASRGGGRARGSGGSLVSMYAAGGAGAGQNRIHINGAPCGKGRSAVLIATSASLLLHFSII
ncbi:hypothetical protein LXL04_035625 [Taraxacum kok-saghyz]